ncbi:MAG: RDD family protein [Acidobacteriaceae bacterium]|nr:RDD family protein [Acidobacteriaceae bacterium]
MQHRRFQLQIRLPEGVLFAVPLAGPVTRCFAFLIDICILSALTTAFQLLTAFIRALHQDIGTGLLLVFYLAAWTLYGVLCEYLWFGQTIGKWLLGIRVVDATGLRLQLHQVVIRNLVRTLDLFPLFGLVAGVSMVSTRRLQRLGDLAAGTVVVRQRSRATANNFELVRGRYNSFAQYHLLCAHVRQKVPPQAAVIALEAIRRRDRFDDRARVTLFDELTAFFQSIVQFPPEASDQLSSEQYVRNVVEILYAHSAFQANLKLNPPETLPSSAA